MLEKAVPAKQADIEDIVPAAKAAAARGDAPHRIAVGAATFADRPDAPAAITTACRRAYMTGKDRWIRHRAAGAMPVRNLPSDIVTRIRERGVSCNVGDTKGHEIAAACGQLAAEACLGVREIDVLCAQADFGSGSSMAVRSRLRPRWRRDMTVPTGTPVTSAIIL